MRLRPVAILGVAFWCSAGLTAACGTAEPIDGEITALIVRGVITDAAGMPLAEATIDVAWRPAVCGGELVPVPQDTTDAAGAFEVTLWEWGTFSRACVHIDAAPPAASGLLAGTAEYDSVPLDPTHGPDTLTVQLTLSAAAPQPVVTRRK